MEFLIYLCREWLGKFPNSVQLAATVGAAVESSNMEVKCPPVVSFDRSNPKRQRCFSGSTVPMENKEKTFQEDAVKAKNSSSKVPSFKVLDMKVCLIMSASDFHFHISVT